jgi:hypothetical protein
VLLLKKIGSEYEIQKLFAFSGIFETLCQIMSEEDSVIVKDCCELMTSLLNDFTRNYIREIPLVYRIVTLLLAGPYQNAAIEFLLAACTDGALVHSLNQRYFARLLKEVLKTAYPVSGQQEINSLRLALILSHDNTSEIEELAHADYTDLLDTILSCCCVAKHHKENLQILWAIVSSNLKICDNFISRITCTPGYSEMDNTVPIFNCIINKLRFDRSVSVAAVCRTLELVLYPSESAKQLALHLPIDMQSGTLLSVLFTCWAEAITSQSPDLPHLSRVLIVWLHGSSETAQKLAKTIYGHLPTILAFLQTSGLSQSLVTLVLSLVCLHSKSADLDSIILNNIGYTEIRNKIEIIAEQPEMKKMQNLGKSVIVDDVFSYPFVKIYQAAVQAVIMHFVKGITENVPEEQKELAKMFEVHEAFSSMQHLQKSRQNDVEKGEFEKKIQELEIENENKGKEIEKLKLKLAQTKHKNAKKNRAYLQSVISAEENLDMLDFENNSLKRENFILHAKIERLTEEIKIFSTQKKDNYSDFKLIEVKEQLKIQMNENTYLKNQLSKTEQAYNEVLEILGKLESQRNPVDITIPEPDIDDSP